MAVEQLSTVPAGSTVFIDANIFVYHFSGPSPLSAACSAFLARIETGGLRGVTSSVVVLEVLHRLMVPEAISRFNLLPREALRYLKDHPDQAKTLVAHYTSVPTILQMGVEAVVVGLEDIARSHDVKRQYGLLTNDALTVAVMERCGVTSLASNDPDFESVPSLALFRPTPF